MKFVITIVSLFCIMGIANNTTDSIYDFKLTGIEGDKLDLASYEGRALLIVNTASECGYTPQYSGLQKLYEEYKEEGFTIIGFPANNFGGQEPGSDHDILQFCEVNYGVTFPLASKVSVKGDDIHPLFAYLTTTENKSFKGDIKWNFEKFLIDKNGNLVERFRSNVKPESEQLKSAIKELL